LDSNFGSVVPDHLPGSVEGVKKPSGDKDQIENHPGGAIQSASDYIEIDLPILGEMKDLEVKDQKESQKDPGDPLKKPAESAPFFGFLVHNVAPLKRLAVKS
jgi:hypothetical protein